MDSLDTQPEKGSAGQRSGSVLTGGNLATNILLLVLIAALLVDIYIRLSPARDVAPVLATQSPQLAPPAPRGHHGSSYTKDSSDQAIIEVSPVAMQPKFNGKPKMISDRVSPAP